MDSQTSHSAPTASSTPSGGSEGDQQNPNPAFSAAGSPPLILAFLAIGLFSAAMVVVFGWRRVHFGRGWALGGMPVDGVSPSGNTNAFLLTKKPKLWEVWNAGCDNDWSEISGITRSKYGWRNIMPLSATVIQSDKPLTEKQEIANAASTFRGRDQSNRRPLFNVIPQRPRENISPANEPESKSSSSSTMDSRLQVAVSIIMPSSTFPIYIKEKNDIRQSREVSQFEYSVGVYSCAWPDQ